MLLLFQGSSIVHDCWQKRLDLFLSAVSAFSKHSTLRVIVQVSQAKGLGGLLVFAQAAKRKSQRDRLCVGNSVINPANILRRAHGLQLHGVLCLCFKISAWCHRLLSRAGRDKNSRQGNQQFFTYSHFLAPSEVAAGALAADRACNLHFITCNLQRATWVCTVCTVSTPFLWKFLIRVREEVSQKSMENGTNGTTQKFARSRRAAPC